jgi:hypothetical protein
MQSSENMMIEYFFYKCFPTIAAHNQKLTKNSSLFRIVKKKKSIH